MQDGLFPKEEESHQKLILKLHVKKKKSFILIAT